MKHHFTSFYSLNNIKMQKTPPLYSFDTFRKGGYNFVAGFFDVFYHISKIPDATGFILCVSMFFDMENSKMKQSGHLYQLHFWISQNFKGGYNFVAQCI